MLAIELTEVFGRLGGAGVRAILGAPPFPVMQRAYKEQPLVDAEIAALIGFLQQPTATSCCTSLGTMASSCSGPGSWGS